MENQKTISILGDSYSTFKGFIPKDYEAWYEDGATSEPNDVTSVEQTWWHMLCKQKNFKLLQNCSYSGSTICNTGYVPILSAHISFIKRMKRELGSDQSEKPDTIIYNVVNDEIADELKNIMAEVCEHYHIINIELTDIDKENGHPNRNGMHQIMEQIAKGLI